MHGTHTAGYLRSLIPVAALALLLAVALFLPAGIARAQTPNAAPTFTSGGTTIPVPENNSADNNLDRYIASDPEGNTLTWTLEGDDAGDFRLNVSGNTTRFLHFINSPNYESPNDSGRNNVYNVVVTLRDNLSGGTNLRRA